uniref:40S ribosomal protein S27 n=1 Tax=Rhinolophus ferrumequinum TaxID=59479 RepID=A0A671EN86_RHIFE
FLIHKRTQWHRPVCTPAERTESGRAWRQDLGHAAHGTWPGPPSGSRDATGAPSPRPKLEATSQPGRHTPPEPGPGHRWSRAEPYSQRPGPWGPLGSRDPDLGAALHSEATWSGTRGRGGGVPHPPPRGAPRVEGQPVPPLRSSQPPLSRKLMPRARSRAARQGCRLRDQFGLGLRNDQHACCYKITTVFSHAQTVVLCVGCSTVLCQPTGGKARLTEGCSFRRKQH